MIRSPRRPLFPTLLVLLSLTAVAACSDDPAGPDEDPILGTWEATAFVGGGFDFVQLGMDLTITLSSDGMYDFEVTNDQVGICENTGDDCTDEGSFAYTGTTVTIDDEDEESAAFNYTINGSTMTWTGSIDTTAVTITWERQ